MSPYKEQEIKEQENLDMLADEAGLDVNIYATDEWRYIGTKTQWDKFEELKANQGL